MFVEEIEDIAEDDDNPQLLEQLEKNRDSIIESFIEKSMKEKHDMREHHEK